MKHLFLLLQAAIVITSLYSCQSVPSTTDPNTEDSGKVKLITLDPGHFHAALVQKNMYTGIDSEVHVYAPGGAELDAYLGLVNQYNESKDNPTHWVETVYTGTDYLDKMLTEKKGNVVVIAGNNRLKTEYIQKAIDAGLNVLADKPMVIDFKNFNALKEAFAKAEENKLLLYDIMTERSEITNILQRELAQMPEVFGEFKKGSVNDPSVVIESVHFFFKHVSGKVLIRPTWFFDPAQQGDAIADVGTHLIDLVQWQCFPEQVLDYKKDINIVSAKIWAEPLTLSQFGLVTNQNAFPHFLKQYVTNDSILQAHGNGEINYTIKGVHVKTIARWQYKATEGGDTHYSLFKGTKANLEIRQGKEENFQPTLYIIADAGQASDYASSLQKAVEKLQTSYAGVTVEKNTKGWKVVIPQEFKVGHEAHFGQVMQRYLQFLKEKKLPEWEVPNMLAKYYTATKGLEMAGKK